MARDDNIKQQGILSNFFGYFRRSYKVTFLIIIGLVILGVWTAITLPRESTPEVEIPVAVVITPYPGASSRDVEELVTKPIEDELLDLEGLDNITSSSRLGVSSIVVEFSADEELDDAIRRLRDEVSNIRGLPQETESPEVMEISFQDEPVVSIGLGGIKDKKVLSLYAEKLQEEIENISGVSQVDITGSISEEVIVEVNPHLLAELGININQLSNSIKTANINAPFGQLETQQFNYDLRITGRFDNISDVSQIPITLPEGEVVELGTIAEVKLDFPETSTASKISLNGQESTPAVTLSVRKQTGGNIVQIVDTVKEKIEQAQKTDLPDNIQIVMFANRADDIRQQLSNVYTSGVQTLIIVFSLLWLFLGWRPAAITSLAIPVTFSMAFLAIDQTGTTLNSISLFSLILSLGLLVDTAIVIVEGVCGHKEEEILNENVGKCDVNVGDNKKEREKVFQTRASIVVDQFTKPLIGGTLTTVGAFFPMLLVTGIIGEFLQVIPIVVTATLLSSLLVALAFIPPVAIQILSYMKPAEEEERWFDNIFSRIREKYETLIDKLLDNKKWQTLSLSVLAVFLIVGLSLPFIGILKTGLFPAVDADFIIINVELDPGKKLEETREITQAIEKDLQTISFISSYVVNLGRGVSTDLSGGSSSEEMASFYVNLEKERDRSSLAVSDELREKFADISGAQIVIEELSAGPPTAPPVEMRLTGEDIQKLNELSLRAMDILGDTEGAIDIDRNLRYSAGEFNFTFNEEALARRDLNIGEIAQTLRTGVFGSEATTYLDKEGEETKVTIENVEDSKSSVDDILSMPLLTRSGQTITVGQVAQIELGSSPDAIRHRGGERTVTVTADAATGYTPNEITQELENRINQINLPDGYEANFGGEQQETIETFNQLYRSMLVAVLIILLILVIEFNSYLQPFVIFLSIPLALIGVLFGLLLFNGQLNFAAFIGLVSLTGIVVNNAIILVDRMNRVRERGASIKEAIVEATNSRLRPIILTTLTTAGGVAPLIWVDEFFRDMAIALINGLIFSTVITLIIIPILYYRQQTKIENRQKQKDDQNSVNTKTSQLTPVP